MNSKEAPEVATLLGVEVLVQSSGKKVETGVLEISDSSSEDRGEEGPVGKTLGSELTDVGAAETPRGSEPIEIENVNLPTEQTEEPNVNPLESTAEDVEIPDGSSVPIDGVED